jgi:drug/metabolite transporter (DMT)-like permease
MGLLGLFMVVSSKLAVASEVNAQTVGFCLCALAGITIGTLYQKRFVQTCDVRTAMTVQVFAALVLTLPLALLENEPVRWNTEMAGALAWSVCVLTLGGSSLLYLLIQRGAATQVTSLMYLVPPVTALLAWVLFGEPITVLTVLGTGLTAWGVSWVVRQASVQPKTE